MLWMYETDDQLDDGGRSEELATLLTFAHGELAKEVFVNLAKGVPLNVRGDRIHSLEQFLEQGVVKAVVGLGQYVLEVGVLRLDGAHGIVDGRADVGPFRQSDQRRETRRVGQIKHAFCLIVHCSNIPPSP